MPEKTEKQGKEEGEERERNCISKCEMHAESIFYIFDNEAERKTNEKSRRRRRRRKLFLAVSRKKMC